MPSEAAKAVSRTELVLGDDAIQRLRAARVVAVGLGGVGSYCVEALARAGVGALDLIDADVIETSNINRQLYALHSTLGRAKVDVARERVADINPSCIVRTLRAFYLPQEASMPGGRINGSIEWANIDEYIAGAAYVADAVDTVAAKVGLIVSARKYKVRVISCMGTGCKIDATQFRLADISQTSVCPLARAVRRALKDKGITNGVNVVYSMEKPVPSLSDTIGSVPFVPAVAGLIMAGKIIKDIALIAE